MSNENNLLRQWLKESLLFSKADFWRFPLICIFSGIVFRLDGYDPHVVLVVLYALVLRFVMLMFTKIFDYEYLPKINEWLDKQEQSE